MNIILDILSLIGIVLLVVLWVQVVKVILRFHRRKCSHCNNTMDYMGMDDDLFLFFCHKCGNSEQVKTEEMFKL